ncbi:MAG: glutamate racemase [Vulcanimicrobiaceae bacterium]
MIGVFDSGLGGLTVVRSLRAIAPTIDLIYLADQAHVPYGDREPDELRAYLAQNVAALDARGVDAIVMGCNTSCAIADVYGWPAARAPVLDLIATAAAAVALTGARRIGVLGTTATVRSGAYGRAIRRLLPDGDVRELAAPELVPLVEAGELRGPRARDAVARACGPFGELDLIVLACTHFPLLDEHFAHVFGPLVPRLDPAQAQAERAAAFAREHGIDRGRRRSQFITNGPLAPFRAALAAILGPLDEMEEVEEERDRYEPERRPGDDLQHRVRL